MVQSHAACTVRQRSDTVSTGQSFLLLDGKPFKDCRQGFAEGGGGGGGRGMQGGLELKSLKVCGPKIGQINISFCKSHCFPP